MRSLSLKMSLFVAESLSGTRFKAFAEGLRPFETDPVVSRICREEGRLIIAALAALKEGRKKINLLRFCSGDARKFSEEIA